MSGSSFVKTLILFMALLVPQALHAEGVAFTESGTLGTPAPGETNTQGSLIAQLKHQAVLNYLSQYLGPRFPQFEKLVARDDKFILDYKVGKSAKDKNVVEITGHLDAVGIKRWVRLIEAKHKTTAGLTPIVIVSSAVPNYNLLSWDTPIRMKDSVQAQTLHAMAAQHLQKFNMKLAVSDLPGLQFREPPRTESEILSLRSSAGHGGAYNSVLWMHMDACKSCGGLKLDTYLYGLPQGRRIVSRSDDIAMPPGDVANPVKLKAILKAPMMGLQSDIEEAISSGTAFGANYWVRVEGVDTYGAYKNLEEELSRMDFVLQIVPQGAEKNSATFKLLSSVSVEELAQRLTQEQFAGFKLKPSSADARSVVVRYVK